MSRCGLHDAPTARLGNDTTPDDFEHRLMKIVLAFFCLSYGTCAVPLVDPDLQRKTNKQRNGKDPHVDPAHVVTKERKNERKSLRP